MTYEIGKTYNVYNAHDYANNYCLGTWTVERVDGIFAVGDIVLHNGYTLVINAEFDDEGFFGGEEDSNYFYLG